MFGLLFHMLRKVPLVLQCLKFRTLNEEEKWIIFREKSASCQVFQFKTSNKLFNQATLWRLSGVKPVYINASMYASTYNTKHYILCANVGLRVRRYPLMCVYAYVYVSMYCTVRVYVCRYTISMFACARTDTRRRRKDT